MFGASLFGFVGFVVSMAASCMFLLHFNDEHHYTDSDYSVFDTNAQLTEGRSAWDLPKQPPAKKRRHRAMQQQTKKIRLLGREEREGSWVACSSVNPSTASERKVESTHVDFEGKEL